MTAENLEALATAVVDGKISESEAEKVIRPEEREIFGALVGSLKSTKIAIRLAAMNRIAAEIQNIKAGLNAKYMAGSEAIQEAYACSTDLIVQVPAKDLERLKAYKPKKYKSAKILTPKNAMRAVQQETVQLIIEHSDIPQVLSDIKEAYLADYNTGMDYITDQENFIEAAQRKLLVGWGFSVVSDVFDELTRAFLS